MTEERAAKINFVTAHRRQDVAIVLENVEDPHNISAVMRSCDAVGVEHLYILTTKIGRHEKWGQRSAASAEKWLTLHEYDNLEACIIAVRARCSKIYATHLGSASESIYDTDFSKDSAIVFGNEHSGVSEEMLAKCDGNIRVPQVGMVQSLNISVACAVILFEGYRRHLLKLKARK